MRRLGPGLLIALMLGIAAPSHAISSLRFIWADTGTPTITLTAPAVIRGDLVVAADAIGVSGIFVSFAFDEDLDIAPAAIIPGCRGCSDGGGEQSADLPGAGNAFFTILPGFNRNQIESTDEAPGLLGSFDVVTTGDGLVSRTVTLGSIWFAANDKVSTDGVDVEIVVLEDAFDAVLAADGRDISNQVLLQGASVNFLDCETAACGDRDEDGNVDEIDNCPDVSNPDQANRDGDSRGDACDLFPDLALNVVAIAPAFEYTDRASSVTYELRDAAGALLTTLVGVRATATVDGSALFGSTASAGILVAGGGTNRALIEFVDGVATLEVANSGAETVVFAAEDSEDFDVELQREVFEDFESNGTFHAISAWRNGSPSSGPGAAFSGSKVWATKLDATAVVIAGELLSPQYVLADAPGARVELRSWVSVEHPTPGTVEISADGGLTWDLLASVSGLAPIDLGSEGEQPYDGVSVALGAYAGSTVQFRFVFPSSPLVEGWYIDDFALIGALESTEFLDPNADSDGDGLSNGDERDLGTDPLWPDSDNDGTPDGADNCPLLATSERRDLVHPGNGGDACDDPDGDGIVDLVDNCPDLSSLDQSNADGDRLGDLCDPYPEIALRFAVLPADWLVSDGHTDVTFELRDAAGSLVSGIRTTVTVDGSAVFGSAASAGILVEGGGTQRALVEFVDGVVTLEVSDPVGEYVVVAGEDSEANGVEQRGEYAEDFEAGGGGFTTSDTIWQYGVPTTGPAPVGTRVWATGLGGSVSILSDSRLVSPVFQVLDVPVPSLLILDRLASVDGVIQVSQDDGLTWEYLATSGNSNAYSLASAHLTDYAGERVRIGFLLQGSSRYRGPGWYIDSIAGFGIARAIEFLNPNDDADADADGLSNGEELALGLDPHRADSDADFALDGADNCPLTANAGQQDAVHPGGGGDACDDPDGDLVVDAIDNCPDTPNPDQANADRDRLGDACDLLPETVTTIRLVAPAILPTNTPTAVTFELRDPSGAILTEVSGVRTLTTLNLSAVFGSSASAGLLVSGADTNRALIEFVDGVVTLEIRDSVVETVQLTTQGYDSSPRSTLVRFRDDPDGDLVFENDNCPDTANPDQANSDGDSLGDACDPYPDHALSVVSLTGARIEVGTAASVVYELQDQTGALVDDLGGVRATLTSSGAAVFGASAGEGVLIEGAGTNRALVEFVAGRLSLEVSDLEEQVVQLGVIDSDSIGIELLAEPAVEHFSQGSGGFSVIGGVWERGYPPIGLRTLFPNLGRGWGTLLLGDYPNLARAELYSPLVELPERRASQLEFQSWFQSELCCDFGAVEITDDGGSSWTTLAVRSGSLGGYGRERFDLGAWAGREIQVRFRFTSNESTSDVGWFIDDFVIRDGAQRQIEFVPEPGAALLGATSLAALLLLRRRRSRDRHSARA